MWQEALMKQLDRKKIAITFDPHVFDRQTYWNLDLNKIEETVRIGKIYDKKYKPPNKLCFTHYYGKENTTYVVIVRYRKHFIEVKTTWSKKGR